MVDAASAGGEVALAHFRRGTEATLKPDGSPVTEADRGAEEAIAEVRRGRHKALLGTRPAPGRRPRRPERNLGQAPATRWTPARPKRHPTAAD